MVCACADRVPPPAPPAPESIQRAAPGPPAPIATPDPIALHVNRRSLRRSEVQAAAASPDPRGALRRLVERELLLQEADATGQPLAPGGAEDRARAFLDRTMGREVICRHITDGEVRRMYRQMWPRFRRGDLYRVAELRWPCPPGDPESATCLRTAAEWADLRWAPILPAIAGPDDLYLLQWLGAPTAPLQYVELTFHVPPGGGRPSVPAIVAAPYLGQAPGHADIVVDARGARAVLLVERLPPVDRPLEGPGVREEVLAELCPRAVSRTRATYLHHLVRGALVVAEPEQVPTSLGLPPGTLAAWLVVAR